MFRGFRFAFLTENQLFIALKYSNNQIINIMDQIKHEIFSQIRSNEVRQFIQDNIFSQTQVEQKYAPLSNQTRVVNEAHSSEMFSSYLPVSRQSKQGISSNFNVKTIISRIEELVVLKGFSRNSEEIHTLNIKTAQLKNQCKQLEKQIENRKSQKLTKIKGQYHPNDTQIMNFQDRMPSLHDFMTFDEEIKVAQEKLKRQTLKEELINLVKLPKQEKSALLERKIEQYSECINYIKTLQKIIQNVETIHPRQNQLDLDIQGYQKEYDQKCMILRSDGGFEVEMELLKKKVQSVEEENKQLSSESMRLFVHNTEGSSQRPHINGVEQMFQKRELMQELTQLQRFIKNEENEKEELLKQIREFNTKFSSEQQRNRELSERIKQNFFSSPQLIDEVVKQFEQRPKQYQFLMDKLDFRLY